MGFQKKHVSGGSEDLDFFFIGEFLANRHLKMNFEELSEKNLIPN
jgi:hypothetical protein